MGKYLKGHEMGLSSIPASPLKTKRNEESLEGELSIRIDRLSLRTWQT